MRILPVVMIGAALLAAGCSSSPQRTSTAPAAQSGAMSSATTPAMQGDSIDRFAAAYEQQRGRRY
jgi:hypothetical protein